MKSENCDIGNNISYYRKLHGMTQDNLAEMLGLSTQAVSKWEQHLSYPDILTLPKITDIFKISMDELFGQIVEKEVIYNFVADLPWQDDSKFRIALFSGRKAVHHTQYECKEGDSAFSFEFHGNPYDFNGMCKIKCRKEKRSKIY